MEYQRNLPFPATLEELHSHWMAMPWQKYLDRLLELEFITQIEFESKKRNMKQQEQTARNGEDILDRSYYRSLLKQRLDGAKNVTEAKQRHRQTIQNILREGRERFGFINNRDENTIYEQEISF